MTSKATSSIPYDLDAVIVEEESAEPFQFTWGGETFELTPLLALPVARQSAFLDLLGEVMAVADPPPAKVAGLVRLIVGDELIAKLSETRGGPDNTPMTTVRLVRLLGAYVAQQGLAGQGKSPTSSRSSGSTARQSKPTSRSGRARRTS